MLARIVGPIALIAATACGGDSKSSTAPSLDVNGAWTGTWQFQTGGLTVTDPVTATVSPYLGQTTITWQGASGWTGSFFVATIGPTFSGALSMQAAALGLSCSGTGDATGTASASAITLDVPVITGTGCTFASSNHFVLHR